MEEGMSTAHSFFSRERVYAYSKPLEEHSLIHAGKFERTVGSENPSSRKDKKSKYPMPIRSRTYPRLIGGEFQKDPYEHLWRTQSAFWKAELFLHPCGGGGRTAQRLQMKILAPSSKSLLRGTVNQPPNPSSDGENFLQTTEDSARCAATWKPLGWLDQSLEARFDLCLKFHQNIMSKHI